MALSKAEVRNAFREVAMRELSTIPPKETIDHSFSKQFYEKMVSLIAEQKRGSWRLLSRQRRRALVVAAILVLSMLLVACTPTLRNAVSDFIVSIYERFIDYSPDVELRPEIETAYGIDLARADFELVSQKYLNKCFWEQVYQDDDQNTVVFTQQAGKYSGISTDNEHGETVSTIINGRTTTVYMADTMCTIVWIQDNYCMTITYICDPTIIDVEELVSAVVAIQ